MVSIDKENDKASWARRFNEVLDAADIPSLGDGRQVAVSKIFKVSNRAAGKWILGESIPRYERILEIVEKFKATGVSVEWLLGGDISLSPFSPPKLISNAEPAPALGKFSRIPIVSHAQLGDNGHWTELEYPVGHGDGYIIYPTKDSNAYALRCVGDSMKPRIKEGEFVIVEPGREAKPGDDVLVKALDGRVMVKTLLYIREGKVHLISINEAHPPQTLLLEQIDKIHPIAAIVNNTLWLPD